MNLIEEHNRRWAFFHEITGKAMLIHQKYHSGLLESAYEAALKFLLLQDGHKVEQQKLLPIYWEDTQLDKYYQMDLVVDDNIIIEFKAVSYIDSKHRKQLWNYMNLTHIPYGMLINFGADSLYSEWYYRNTQTEDIERIRLI